MGITNACLMPKKYMKMLQIIYGIVLLYIAVSIQDSSTLDFDVLIGIMSFFPIIMGITGKCIPARCLKYGEPVKKIRV